MGTYMCTASEESEQCKNQILVFHYSYMSVYTYIEKN